MLSTYIGNAPATPSRNQKRNRLEKRKKKSESVLKVRLSEDDPVMVLFWIAHWKDRRRAKYETKMYDTSHKLTRFQKRNRLYRPSALQAEGLKKTLKGAIEI